MKKRLVMIGIVGLALIAPSMAFAHALRYPPARWIADADSKPFAFPPPHHPYNLLDAFLGGTGEEIQTALSMAGNMRGQMMGHLPLFKVEAINTNNFDEVADSTWFTNRIGRYGPRPDEATKPMAGCSPASSGPLIVQKALAGQNAPVLLIEGEAPSRFIFLPDPADRPGEISSPAAAAAMILDAAGYNAASHCPATIDRGRLSVADGSNLIGEYGENRTLSPDDLPKLLEKQPQLMRGVAIRMPEGQAIGRFEFSGRLPGDKNDLMRHQDRRELRGLRVFSSFIGWINISDRTPYDEFIDTNGKAGYVKHWLLNLTEIVKPEETFNPVGTGASGGNAAFGLLTKHDAFWAARIVSLFSDQLIDSIIAAAGYPDALKAKDAVDGLKLRRDAIAKYWFERINSLDDFTLSRTDGTTTLTCRDLSTGLEGAGSPARIYRARLTTTFGRSDIMPWRESAECAFPLEHEAALSPGRTYEFHLQAKEADKAWWLPEIILYLRFDADGPGIAGLKRR